MASPKSGPGLSGSANQARSAALDRSLQVAHRRRPRAQQALALAAAALLFAACSPTPARVGTTAPADAGMLASDEGATVPEPPDASRPEVASHVDTFGAPWPPADVETGPREGGQALQWTLELSAPPEWAPGVLPNLPDAR
jgi:hypothetical protein